MNDQNLEERLARSLDQQAAGLHDAPFGLDDVRGRARRIRHRRRGIAAGAAAAVLALVVPTALLVGGGGERAVDPAGPPTSPGSSILHDGVVTDPDGRTVAAGLPGDVTAFGILADGRIVATTNSSRRILVLDAEGRRSASYPTLSTTFTMGEEDRTVAWTGPDYRLRVLESGSPDPLIFPGIPMPGEGEGSIDAVLGSGCADGGCRVLGGDYVTTTVEITLEGARDLSLPEPFRVDDLSPDGSRWAVTFPPATESDQFGCVGLYDVDAGAVLARNCDTSGLRFAPDGRHLLGLRGDNNLFGQADVLDLELRPVRTQVTPERVVSRAGWVDGEHLAVSVVDLDGSRWSLVRVPLDGGAVQTLDGPAPGGNPEQEAEYVFSE